VFRGKINHQLGAERYRADNDRIAAGRRRKIYNSEAYVKAIKEREALNIPRVQKATKREQLMRMHQNNSSHNKKVSLPVLHFADEQE